MPECEGLLLGPFTYVIKSSKRKITYHMHRNCAVWHPPVFENDDGFVNMDACIKHAKKTKCYGCNEKGATLGCSYRGKRCCRPIHFRCALIVGASLLCDLGVRCNNHNTFSFDPIEVAKHIERTPVDSAVLRYGNTCTRCEKVSYDDAASGLMLTCNHCFGRVHSRCLVSKSDEYSSMLAVNSFKGRHYCEKCMHCSICDNHVDQRAYAIRRRCASLKQDDELDWDFGQESNEDCNVLLCVGCNHFAVHIDCLGPRASQRQWRCSLCYNCRHCNNIAVHENEWNEQYEACAVCYRKIKNDGVICPICRKLYKDHEGTAMIQCDGCDCWIHAVMCGGMSTQQFKEFTDDTKKYFCPLCVKKRSGAKKVRSREGVERLLTLGGSTPKGINTVLLKIPPPQDESAFYSIQPSNKDDGDISTEVLEDLAISSDICRRCCASSTKGELFSCVTCGDCFHEFCILGKTWVSFPLDTSDRNVWQCAECRMNWDAQSFLANNEKLIRKESPETPIDDLKRTHRKRKAVRWNDTRKCEFCDKGERKGSAEGQLIVWSSSMNCDLSDTWVHVGCVLWATGMTLQNTSETCRTIIGPRRTLLTAAKRSRCAKCGKNGSTVKCSSTGCVKTFHFHCAGPAGVECSFWLKKSMRKKSSKRKMKTISFEDIDNIRILCKKHCATRNERHALLLPIFDAQQIFESNRLIRVIDSQGYMMNPEAGKKRVISMNRSVKVRVGPLAVVRFGEIIPEVNDFIMDGCLVPLGYCAVRRFWSMKKVGKRCTYFFEVGGHPQGGPTFALRCSEDLNMKLEDIDPDRIWGVVWRKAMLVQLGRDMNDSSELCRSALDTFGLLNCEMIGRHIESLPLASMLKGRYRSRWDVDTTDNDVVFYEALANKYIAPTVEANRSDSARVEGYRRRQRRRRSDVGGPFYDNVRSGSAFQLGVAREMLYDSGDKRRCTPDHRSIVVEGTHHRRGDGSSARATRASIGNNLLTIERSGKRNKYEIGNESGRGRKRRRSGREVKAVKGFEDFDVKVEGQDVDLETNGANGKDISKNECIAPLAKSKTIILRSEIDGWGVFATRNIAAGELIIEYVGEIIRPSLSDIREQQYMEQSVGCYMFEIVPGEIVDATMCGNAARYINHSCVPNCFSKTIWTVDSEEQRRRQVVAIFSKRRIQRGEELSYDYQFPYDEIDRVKCGCGAEQCKGFMN